MTDPGDKKYWKEIISAAAFLLLAAVIFTWPLVLHLGSAVPQGSEPEAVAVFQLFTMQWTGLSLEQGFSYWDAPFFYPFRGAFAWCEPQPFTAAAVWIVSKAAGYIPAYNIILLFYMVLMGMAGYVLARLLTADRTAACFSAVWLCCGAFAMQQLCAPALLASGFAFFCIVFLILFHLRQKRRYFWLALFSYVAVFFTHKQSAFYLLLFLPAVSWPWLFRHKRMSRAMARCALGTLLVLLAVLPYALKQWRLTSAMGFDHVIGEVRAVIKPQYLFTPAQGHWLATHILGRKSYSWDIGIVCVLLIIAAFLTGLFGKRLPEPRTRNIVLGLCSLLAAALILAIGPALPGYGFLFENLPGLSFIRAPMRSMLFGIFSVAVLSAWAFAWLRRRCKTALFRRSLSAAVFILLVLEMWTMPIALVFPGSQVAGHRGVIDWLKDRDPQAAVLELPLKKGSSWMEAAAMLRMLHHRHPLINGYATFAPVAYRQLKEALIDDPLASGQRFCRAYAVGYILVHRHELSEEESVALSSAFGAETVYEDQGHLILRPAPDDVYIEEGELYMPYRADFGSKMPVQGKVYATRLSKPLSRAILLDMSGGKQLRISWKDDVRGERKEQALFLKGSVILDAGADRIYYRMKRFSPGSRRAEAVLVAGTQ